jgi:hypothetical protein
MADEGNDALLGLLSEAIVAHVRYLVEGETAFVVTSCGCFGAVIFAAVGFDTNVCCRGDDDDKDCICGVAAEPKGGFIVLGIPHIRASVVLTTFRPGLLGSHIFDLSSTDMDLLSEPLSAAFD